ncbi:MAG: hypothetical protein IIA41_02140, partial [SAR324 cluster bacterium]|nr:hypothetical protein [SAR324 cluster bacterium]
MIVLLGASPRHDKKRLSLPLAEQPNGLHTHEPVRVTKLCPDRIEHFLVESDGLHRIQNTNARL